MLCSLSTSLFLMNSNWFYDVYAVSNGDIYVALGFSRSLELRVEGGKS